MAGACERLWTESSRGLRRHLAVHKVGRQTSTSVESRCDGQVGLISTFFDFARSITCKIARSEPTPMTDVRSGNVCSLVDVVCMTFWKQTSCAVFAPGFHLGLHDIAVTFLRLASNSHSRAAIHGINKVAL